MCTQCVINIVSDVVDDLLEDGVQITTPMLYDIIADEAQADEVVADVAVEWVNNIGAPYEIAPMLSELMCGWKPNK